MPVVESHHQLAYLINLDRRPDRWNDFRASSTNLMFKVEKFSAVDANNLPLDELRLPPAVAACWMSHQEIAKALLASSAQHCLVLEDDVLLSEEGIKSLNRIMESDLTGIDLLQLGFCVHNNRLANRRRYGSQIKLVKAFNLFHILSNIIVMKLLDRIYGAKFIMLNQISQLVAKETFELGTHAYLLSRKFAEAITEFNTPVYLPADLAIMELVRTGEFATYRLLTSALGQSDSPSSISNAARNSLELEISLLGAGNVD